MKKLIYMTIIALSLNSMALDAFKNSDGVVSCTTNTNYVDVGFSFEIYNYNFLKDTLNVATFNKSFLGETFKFDAPMKLKKKKFLLVFNRGYIVETEDKSTKMIIKKDMTGRLIKLQGEKIDKDLGKLTCK